MKSAKRCLAMVLALVLAVAVLAPAASADESVTLTTFFEIAPPIQAYYNAELRESLPLTKHIKEVTGIELQYLWEAPESAEDSVQKKNTAIASGEIPDFMRVNKEQLALLAKTDLIMKDLDELWNTYASDNLKAWTTKEGTMALDTARFKGKLVAIPELGSSIDYAPFLYIRQDWLDKLGLERPTNLDELYNVMVAFKEQDPDGNGKNDTIGLNISKDLWKNQTFISDAVGLFNSFGAYTSHWVDDGNGGLMFGAIAPEVKDALAFLQKLYNEGLIAEDFQVNDEGKAMEAIAASKVGIQYGASWNTVFPLYMGIDNDPDMRWVALPLLGKDGPARPEARTMVNYYIVISSDCKHPEAVIQLLNAYVDSFGFSTPEEYQSYLYANSESEAPSFPQHFFMLKTENPLQYLEDWYLIKEAYEKNDPSIVEKSANAKTNYETNVKFDAGDLSQLPFYGNMGLKDSAFVVMAEYYENDMFQWDLFTGAPTKSMGGKMGSVQSKILEYYTKVIMGVESLDNWDKFVKDVNKLGLDKITKEVNEWYADR